MLEYTTSFLDPFAENTSFHFVFSPALSDRYCNANCSVAVHRQICLSLLENASADPEKFGEATVQAIQHSRSKLLQKAFAESSLLAVSRILDLTPKLPLKTLDAYIETYQGNPEFTAYLLDYKHRTYDHEYLEKKKINI